MARRKFNLPGIQDLSKEQEDARALPKNGQYLIVGGPGTGKSVLALLRSRRHHNDGDNYSFLVFNHLLKQASKILFGDGLSIWQWQSWFLNYFKKLTGEEVPRLPPEGNSTWRKFDWDRIAEIIGQRPVQSEQALPYLVIDEGQDMPPQFYRALVNLGFENFYVVADQNQQIEPGRNSTRQDIQDCLGIEADDVIELHLNYRNKYPIARLAREFYTGDPASPPPKLPPSRTPTARRPMLFEYGKGQYSKLIERVLKTSDRDPSKLLGIIAPNNFIRKNYYNSLVNSSIQLDNGRPNIRTFKSGDRKAVEFDEGGIIVINAQACKGLEFDTVFLADINQYRCVFGRLDMRRRLFYVMVARAIDQVIMLKEAGSHCPVDAILPDDRDVLERR